MSHDEDADGFCDVCGNNIFTEPCKCTYEDYCTAMHEDGDIEEGV